MSENYFSHKGILFPAPGFSEKNLNYVENEFPILDDDIINVTYPKSGTNWISQILSLIKHGGDTTWVCSEPVWHRVPWIETANGMEYALKYPPPRFLASHLLFQLFPKSFTHSKAKDPRGCVERICRFIGKELNGQQIDSVVENSSFQKMKDNKMSNFTLVPDIYVDHQKGQLMRKGICEDWRNHLTPEQEEHFDRVYREKMRDVSVAFPWD